jgi:Predicted acetyltransferase
VGWSEMAYRQAYAGINNSTFIIAVYNRGKAIGMARVISDGGYVSLIADVIVMPEFQNMGIGKTIMKMVMEYINSMLEEGEKVFINLMAAKGRESFYKQFGFVERPNDELGAGMTQWISK